MRARNAYRLSLVILGLASLVNVVVAIRVLFALRSPVSYNFRVVEPPVFTNVFTSGSFAPRMPGETVEESSGKLCVSNNSVVASAFAFSNCVEVAVDQYHFMRVDGLPRIRLNGQTYVAGDVCAYGRISSIFPERIYFDDGSYLTNSRRIFDLLDSHRFDFHPSELKKDIDPDERKSASNT